MDQAVTMSNAFPDNKISGKRQIPGKWRDVCLVFITILFTTFPIFLGMYAKLNEKLHQLEIEQAKIGVEIREIKDLLKGVVSDLRDRRHANH